MSGFGPNTWLVDEMFRKYQEDPSSVDEAWAEFFEGYRPRTEAPPAQAPQAPPAAAPAEDLPEGAAPLTGAGALIARNMTASLAVPTATSIRTVPARLLEENRRIMNRHLGERGKVSFTHLIGWAVVSAMETVPAMKRSYAEAGGKPHVVTHQATTLGLAVDVEREDGTRTLLVPNIKDASAMDFEAFWRAYEDVIRRTRAGKLTPDDFAGTTATLTNPGTIGTQLSIPRLMQGQGVIVGVGRVDLPTSLRGADPAALAEIGVGKEIGLTSTYDHRVIQGAESGAFLAQVERLLLGEDGFYDDIFTSLGVPHEPIRWTEDRRAALPDADRAQAAVLRLVNMYRVRGHLIADIDPLGNEDALAHPELDLEDNGLSVWDLDRPFLMDPESEPRPLREILEVLQASYTGSVGIEYMHIQSPDEKRWIRKRVEGADRSLPVEDKRHLLERLNAAEAFERFLHTKYVGHKRYGLEGAESLIPMLDALLEEGVRGGAERVVIGMAHRGRLNVLANIVGKSYHRIFREFEGDVDPESIQGSGDVQYHVGTAGKYQVRAGETVAVEVVSNPSHLEAVNPVVQGIARAAQFRIGDAERSRVLPVTLHGDAAFAGEGVVAETLGMSQLPGFATGGTVHVVINNQLGFTTPPSAARSSTYATDVARMIQAPIFHVNGDDPEACVWVMHLALAYRQAFHKDVVVDLLCYRRFGHNEADDPSYTQPVMYRKIEDKRPVRKIYMERLINRGDITLEEAESALKDYRGRLEQAFDEVQETRPPQPQDLPASRPTGVLPPVETGVDRETLDRIVAGVTSWPEGFTPHPKLAKQLEKRRSMLAEDRVDWSMAEALAFGSLVLEGVPVRLSGQDSRRGTFSQRHALLVDHETGREHYPLASLSEDQASFAIFDSPLNEFATLGFEYGYSVEMKDALVLWEAQFGDFFNEAQVIVDQFLVAGEDKWAQTSGLVLLLPHGMEGQGPEHSSARVERFLTLCANDNMQVAAPTTPAQFFHLLRRQVRRELRKPLVVLTPKSFLRLPAARSAAADLETGSFREVVVDETVSADAVTGAILCAGKVFYDLAEARRPEVAVIRVEQLYPFPERQILDALGEYPGLREVRWVQEEPENMGAYGFVHARLHTVLPEGVAFSHAARPENSAPASGSHNVHQEEQEALIQRAFEGL